jgi:hypothetical protein
MKVDFVELANAIKKDMESKYTEQELAQDYIYPKLDSLITEWKSGHFSSKDTDIGSYACIRYDSPEPAYERLGYSVIVLSEMYRRRSELMSKDTEWDKLLCGAKEY